MIHEPLSLALRFESDPGFAELRVVALEGREALSTLYRFDVTVRAPVHETLPPPRDLVGRTVVLGFTDHERVVHGIVSAVDGGLLDDNHRAELRVTVVPSLYRLSLTHRSRVFLDKTLPDLIALLLEDHGYVRNTDFRVGLTGTHPTRPYTLQYEESDLAFLMRLCEEAGVFFFFEHTEARTSVVFADDNAAFARLDEALPFDPRKTVQNPLSVTSLVERSTLQPLSVMVRGYNHGQTRVVASAQVVPVAASEPVGSLAQRYAPYHDALSTEALCNGAANLAAERLLCDRDVVTMTGRVPGLHAGECFSLVEHPLSRYDKEYLPIAVEHRAHSLDGPLSAAMATAATLTQYEHTITAIARTVAFRPAKVTPKPVMPSLLVAVIDGPTNTTAAPIDEQGRYRVVLPFDTIADRSRAASAPIALLQAFSGTGYGLHCPLHAGAQVLLGHLHNDPDRPVIVGALPSGFGAPYVTRANATQNVLQTLADVRMEIDDDAPGWVSAASARAAKRSPDEIYRTLPGGNNRRD